MVRDGWLTLPDRLNEIAGADLVVGGRAEEVEEAQADWVAESAEALCQLVGVALPENATSTGSWMTQRASQSLRCARSSTRSTDA
jgi:hypothetical protein